MSRSVYFSTRYKSKFQYEAAPPHLVHYESNDVAGNGKAETFATARLRENQGVDTDEAPVDVDQRSAAVAGINGCVSLEIN